MEAHRLWWLLLLAVGGDEDLLLLGGAGSRGSRGPRRAMAAARQDLKRDPEPPLPASAENHDFGMVRARWSGRRRSEEDRRGWEQRGEEWFGVAWTASEPCLNRCDQANGWEADFNAAHRSE